MRIRRAVLIACLAWMLGAPQLGFSAAVFDQFVGSNMSKTSGTSLTISPSSITVTSGKTIFVAFASDDVGSGFGITDNLGNTYTQVGSTATNAGNVKTQLWRAPVTSGGSITSIVIAWTTNITAKAAVAGEFSNFGSENLTDTDTNTANTVYGPGGPGASDGFACADGELWVGAIGWEAPNGDDLISTPGGSGPNGDAEAGQNGTTGGGTASNITAQLVYALNTTTASGTSCELGGFNNTSSTRDGAGVGAIYNAAGGGGTAVKDVIGNGIVPFAR